MGSCQPNVIYINSGYIELAFFHTNRQLQPLNTLTHSLLCSLRTHRKYLSILASLIHAMLRQLWLSYMLWTRVLVPY
jgi:hypothetical protein